MIDTPSGRIPLREVADIADSDSPDEIIRDNGHRRIAIMINTNGSDMTAITRHIEAQIARLKVPVGYYLTIEGNYKEQQAAMTRIGVLSLVSILLIFAILYSRYNSAVLSLIIMANVPLALVGAVFAMRVSGGTLSLATAIGFITLAGISTRNGILKISHYINLVLHEDERFGRKMIVRGSLERMTPVLMTALSAGLTLVPIMIGGAGAGTEILAPVAVVIFGGLISATLLDAVLTPILFLRFGEKPLVRLQEQLVPRQDLGSVLAPGIAAQNRKPVSTSRRACVLLLPLEPKAEPASDGPRRRKNSGAKNRSYCIGSADRQRPATLPGRTADWASCQRDAPVVARYSILNGKLNPARLKSPAVR